MNDLSQLKPKLVRLKLSGVLETLEQRIAQAMEEKWEYSQFLLNLLTDEVIRRDNRQLTLRVGRSGLNPEKTIASFDFSFNKHIHKPTIRELATCSFIEQRRNLFFVGPSGVGKSHLSQALGNEACLKNIDVMYRGTHELLKWINAGRADGIAYRGRCGGSALVLPVWPTALARVHRGLDRPSSRMLHASPQSSERIRR
jgi:DNA replication protein DnaC